MALLGLERQWMPQEIEHKLFGLVSVLKKGKWDKDDAKNKYNSHIDIDTCNTVVVHLIL